MSWDSRSFTSRRGLNISGSGQRFIHEPSFGKTGPPLGRLPVLAAVEDPIAEPVSGFVTQLQEVLTQNVGLLRGPRTSIDPVERESRLSGQVESGDGERIHFALALRLGWTLLQLLEAILAIMTFKIQYFEALYTLSVLPIPRWTHLSVLLKYG